MKEKKLTDEEIVRALKMQPVYNIVLYLEQGINATDILDLINRLQSENKALHKLTSKTQIDLMFDQAKTIENQKAEIERLTDTLNQYINGELINVETMGKIISLEKQVDELKVKLEIAEGTKDRLTIFDRIAIHDKAVKDTAKEICDLILEHWEKKQFVECDWLRVAISERYGVEVE